jgi:Transposase, Mutator family
MRPATPSARVAVNTGGRREIVGLACGASEAQPFWSAFLKSLVKRGLRGVKLVVSDAHCDSPMVAPNYAKQRSELAKAIGLGQLRRNQASGSDPTAQFESTPEPGKKARGRRKRTAEAA